MKTLKFSHSLVAPIQDGKKTATWRLFDDKDLQAGNVVEFLNSETKEKFTEAEITNIREKALGKMEGADFEGHEKYKDSEDMMEHYRRYYGNQVSAETIVKIITFKLI